MSWFSTSLLKSHAGPTPRRAVSGTRRHLPQLRDVLERVLVAHRVFDEVGLVLFDHPAGAEGVVQVEALVEVDAPVAVCADAFADLLAVLRRPAAPLGVL